ncbi:hypothetical protein KPH14_009891 [Odynerus spinipes]|uniref:RNA-directed DNA polymerase n=1 Tax=Odynerus spinipes TaxID=1348599 RepID=A0AAD9REB7_9HYME|nr:hypothetical protein KPH14_009891 [Odynerus spinipes]
MKSVARQYFWWPGLDKDIEEFGKRCLTCRSSAHLRDKAALVKFKEAERPFERVHIDVLGPFKGKVYLIIVDAYSKWPEIVEMVGGADTNNTIEKLRKCFARNAPHESTGETPAQRMFGRRLRTRFDLLNKPKVEEAADRQTEHFTGGREMEFSEGETVLVRDYRDPGKPRWELAVIKGKPGSRTYICQPLSDPELEWKRHTDQIIKREISEKKMLRT